MSTNKTRWDKLAQKNAVNEFTKSEKNAILDNIASGTSKEDNTQDDKQPIVDSEAQGNTKSNTQTNTQENTLSNTQNTTQSTTQFSMFVHQMDIQKHKTVEQTHTRKNYLIRNDIIAQLDKEAKLHSRGWPTKLINGLLEEYLTELKRLRESK